MNYLGYLESKSTVKDNLKPCPFCGASAKYGNWAGGGGVWCVKCGAIIRRDHTSNKETGDITLGGDISAEAWNRRVERSEDAEHTD